MDYAGTQSYFSPEIIREQLYDEKIDVWALGCVMYFLAALQHPFECSDYLAMTRSILQIDPSPLPATYSPEFSNFVTMMLRKDPRERPSAHELLEELSRSQSQIQVPSHLGTITTFEHMVARSAGRAHRCRSNSNVNNMKMMKSRETNCTSLMSTDCGGLKQNLGNVWSNIRLRGQQHRGTMAFRKYNVARENSCAAERFPAVFSPQAESTAVTPAGKKGATMATIEGKLPQIRAGGAIKHSCCARILHRGQQRLTVQDLC